MNSLSWLIYGADVIPALGVVFGIMAGALLVAILVTVLYGATLKDTASNYGDKTAHPNWIKGHAIQIKALKFSLIIVPLMLLCVLTPSRQTVLLIAASEAGETVVKSQEAQEIFRDLQQILRDQLAQFKGTKT